jgi:hypothetical protein
LVSRQSIDGLWKWGPVGYGGFYLITPKLSQSKT